MDIRAAIDFVLRQEDATLAGRISDLGDGAGLTRFGLTSRWHPELVAQGFFSASLPPAQALPIAISAYAAIYTRPLALDQLTRQAVGTALLSFAVNDGNYAAITLLQEALAAGVVIDGVMGPHTIDQVNASPEPDLLARYCAGARAHYRQVVENNPADARFLNGWMNRVDALEKLA